MVARALLLALLAGGLPGRAWADDTTVAACGARKVDAAARACRDVLVIEARFRGDGDAGARAERLAARRARLAAAWGEAERAAVDPRCATHTATADATLDRLI